MVRGFPLRSRLSRFHDVLNMIAIIGTSDRLCWLAETCKILLLLRTRVTDMIRQV